MYFRLNKAIILTREWADFWEDIATEAKLWEDIVGYSQANTMKEAWEALETKLLNQLEGKPTELDLLGKYLLDGKGIEPPKGSRIIFYFTAYNSSRETV